MEGGSEVWVWVEPVLEVKYGGESREVIEVAVGDEDVFDSAE
jgi:hypothetical protein